MAVLHNYTVGTRLHVKTTEKKCTLPAHHHSPGSSTLCNQPAAFFKICFKLNPSKSDKHACVMIQMALVILQF